MDGYFKLLRAREEIMRLNVEVPRLATFMRDEEAYLSVKEAEVCITNPALAHQIHIHRLEKSRYIGHHTDTLNEIISLKGFTGGPLFGTRVRENPALPILTAAIPQRAPSSQVEAEEDVASEVEVDGEQDLEEEQAGEDEEVAVLEAYCSVFALSLDDYNADVM